MAYIKKKERSAVVPPHQPHLRTSGYKSRSHYCLVLACILLAISFCFPGYSTLQRPSLSGSVKEIVKQVESPPGGTSLPNQEKVSNVAQPPPIIFETHSNAKLDEKQSMFLKGRRQCETRHMQADSLLVQKSLTILEEKMSNLEATTPVDKSSVVERAAICTIQKNEDWYLQEWIDYHLALGFTDIYIYNHGQADITPTDHIHPLPVEIASEDENDVDLQKVIYNTCLEVIKKRKLREHGSYDTTWAAFFDIDEFLVLKRHETVQGFLADHCPDNGLSGSIGINWQWFGTANQTYYEDKPVTQRFLYRDYRPHKIIKSIVRVDEAYCMTNAHFPHFLKSIPLQNMSQPPFSYDTSGGIIWGPYSRRRHDEVAVLHHYVNSLEEWYFRRCRRGDVDTKNKNRRCKGMFPEAGVVYDDSASRFFQTHVLDKKQRQEPVVRPPTWKHIPETEFGIQEFVPLSQIAPEPPDESKEPAIFLDWEQIPPAKIQSYLPNGFPEPPAAETLQFETANGAIPPFVQKRHKCLAQIRQLQRERFQSVAPSNETKPFVLYLDPAYHKNVGDGLLTLGTLSTLLRQGVSDIQQCHYHQALNRVAPCEEVIPNTSAKGSSKLAVWHPGGNWGDLWVNVQQKRIQSFSVLLENGYSIFGFPQSLFYFNETRGKLEAQLFKESIAKGLQVNLDMEHGLELAKSRVVLSWREMKSCQIADELYPFVTNVLMPDAAFQLGPFNLTNLVPDKLKVDVVLFMRNDKESLIRGFRNEKIVAEIFRNSSRGDRQIDFAIVDWVDRNMFNPKVKPHHVTEEAIYLVSMAKVIVADRLHATILSYLAGVPVIYIDQISGKISNTLEFFTSLEACRDTEAAKLIKASNFTHALELATRLLEEEESD